LKAVLLNSGGIDTLAAAQMLKEQGHELHSLFIGMGQPNQVLALIASKKIADAYCSSHFEFIIPGEWSVSSPNAPAGGISIPYLTGVVFLMGCVYARKIGVEYIVSAVKGTHVEAFKPTLLALQKANSIIPVIIIPITPLENKSDAEVYEMVKNNPLLKETVSCAWSPPCGVCKKCLDRKAREIDVA